MVNLYTKMKKAAGAVLAVAMGMTCIPTPLAVMPRSRRSTRLFWMRILNPN